MPRPQQIGDTFESLRPSIGPPTCKVCRATMVPLFTSFYCEACERKANPRAFDKRYTGPAVVHTPRQPLPPRPAQVAGIREVWTTKGRALYVTSRGDVPPAWSTACWVPSMVCGRPLFDKYGDDPARPFDSRPNGTWNVWRSYAESQALRNFVPPKPGITAALYVV